MITYENSKIEIQVNIGIPMGAGGDSTDMDDFLETHPEWQILITSKNIIQLRDEFSAWYHTQAPNEWVSPEQAAAAAAHYIRLGSRAE